MPQLDPTSFASQVFWLVVTFVTLYILLVRVALPQLAGTLQKRQDRIDDDLAAAETLKKEAESVLGNYEKLMADSRTKAQARIQETAERLAREAEARNAALGDKLAREAAAAEARIAAARKEALANLRSVATDAARAAVGRLSGLDVSEDKAREAVAAVARAYEDR
ncbi:MAG: F0F1 ATP synthase subunit B' [Alphaproteobacteria bacterium]|nr:F0F1 ATP synthase subunit B' [Alphaproteobacteria bacterium]